jgi:hypothetical protein
MQYNIEIKKIATRIYSNNLTYFLTFHIFNPTNSNELNFHINSVAISLFLISYSSIHRYFTGDRSFSKKKILSQLEIFLSLKKNGKLKSFFLK